MTSAQWYPANGDQLSGAASSTPEDYARTIRLQHQIPKLAQKLLQQVEIARFALEGYDANIQQLCQVSLPDYLS